MSRAGQSKFGSNLARFLVHSVLVSLQPTTTFQTVTEDENNVAVVWLRFKQVFATWVQNI